MTFLPDNNTVWMVTDRGPVSLSEQGVEGLLDVFEREGAAALFNSLYEAHLACGGIERTSSMRAA